MGVDGSGVENISNHDSLDYHPMGSPDGTRIAFLTRRDGTLEIYTMARDGSDARRLTHGADSDIDPTWNGAGTRIAFDS
ncbi:MAG: Tol biopolymer transport system component, partial [Thalassolituus oleivorans]